jgi:hypothetical protein
LRISVNRFAAAAAGLLLTWCAPAGNGVASAQVAPPAQTTKSSALQHLLTSDSGIVLNFIKPDRTADFEAVVAKLKEALQKSSKPERRQQAASWKVYRSPEPGPAGSVLYVFTMDPAVKDADYTVSTILAEAFPAEAMTLLKQYSEAYATGYNFIDLTLIQDLAK